MQFNPNSPTRMVLGYQITTRQRFWPLLPTPSFLSPYTGCQISCFCVRRCHCISTPCPSSASGGRSCIALKLTDCYNMCYGLRLSAAGDSSSGRTTDSGSVSRGSNPRSPAIRSTYRGAHSCRGQGHQPLKVEITGYESRMH